MDTFLWMVLIGTLLFFGAAFFLMVFVLKDWKKIPEQKVKDWGKVNRCTDCGKQFGATQRTTFTKSGWPSLKRIFILQEAWVEVDEKKRIRLFGKLLEVKVLCQFCADQLRQEIEEETSSQSRRTGVYLIFFILFILVLYLWRGQ